MSEKFRTIVEPTSELITVSDVHNYSRIDFSDTGNDAVITDLIIAARKLLEGLLNRALATQTIRVEYIVDRPAGGILSGTIDYEPNWYQYEQALGANPFGIAQFYYDLPMPPVQSISAVEYQYTVFDASPVDGSRPYWTPFTGVYVPDYDRQPCRIWFQDPPTVYRWRFTYVAGYDGVNWVLPGNIKQLVKKIVDIWVNDREADPLPQIKN